jgi:hypothetical protein
VVGRVPRVQYFRSVLPSSPRAKALSKTDPLVGISLDNVDGARCTAVPQYPQWGQATRRGMFAVLVTALRQLT